MNRMLTRHQLVVQQTSPNKKRKINSNSIDEELIHIESVVFSFRRLIRTKFHLKKNER